MLTHGQVTKLLSHAIIIERIDEIDGIEIEDLGKKFEAIPDRSSSSKPPQDLDIPEYWQIFNNKIYVATLFNENYEDALPQNKGIAYAVFGGDYTIFDIPLEEIRLLDFMLRILTKDMVYFSINYRIETFI